MNEHTTTIEIENFGPIRRGDIELKPLTVFIGPNNSGKSCAAILIHSLYTAFHQILSFDIYFHIDQAEREKCVEIGGSFKTEDDIFREGNKEISVYRNEITQIAEKLLTKRIRSEIENSYSTTLENIVRKTSKTFRIIVNQNSRKLIIENSHDTVKVTEYPGLSEYPLDVKKIKHTISGHGEHRTLTLEFVDMLAALLREAAGEFIKKPYFLPSTRSGILQVRKALTEDTWKQVLLSRMGSERDAPKIPGVVSEFLLRIAEIPSRKGKFYELACELEDEILGEKIAVKNIEQYGYPEIEYTSRESFRPFHMVSSSGLELAPFILYLKYVIAPGDTVIIEEPESHLHPENQSILAKYLVRLIRNNVNLIITTHSELLLRKISHFVLLGTVGEEKRVRKYGYRKDDFLLPEDVSVHVFNLDQEGGTIEKVKTKEGIMTSELLKAHESLYDETSELLKDIESQ